MGVPFLQQTRTSIPPPPQRRRAFAQPRFRIMENFSVVALRHWIGRTHAA